VSGAIPYGFRSAGRPVYIVATHTGAFPVQARTLAVLLASAMLAATTAAQEPIIGQEMHPQYRSLIALNPLGIPFEIASIEGETAITAGMTAGVAVSYADIDAELYRTLDLKARYYPGEIALRGFSMGLSLGYTQFGRPDPAFTPADPDVPEEAPRVTLGSTTVGITVDYNWMVGAAERFVVGGGFMAKRVLASPARREAIGLDRAYPAARFVVGLAF
jgi:hypothetical protein